MRIKSRPLKCEECRTVYGSTYGPVKRGRYIMRAGSSMLHICPGKPKQAGKSKGRPV